MTSLWESLRLSDDVIIIKIGLSMLYNIKDQNVLDYLCKNWLVQYHIFVPIKLRRTNLTWIFNNCAIKFKVSSPNSLRGNFWTFQWTLYYKVKLGHSDVYPSAHTLFFRH